jgi:predicted flavoprotein YhiN
MHSFDVVVIGAGAAGLFCAGVAGQSGLKVLLVDHTDKIAEKIRISGGGRCNFTNLHTGPGQLPGREPAVLPLGAGRLPPGDFIDLVRRHGIGYHEKHKGQLFCDRSAQDLITMLLTECVPAA